MKKLLLLLILVPSLCFASIKEKLRLEWGSNLFGAKSMQTSFGSTFGIGLDTQFVDVALVTRGLINGLSSGLNTIGYSHLRVDGKYTIESIPLTIFAGIGPGFGLGKLNGNDIQGIAVEFSTGARYPLTQFAAAYGRLMYVLHQETENGIVKNYSGGGIEIGMRFAFEPTVRLKY